MGARREQWQAEALAGAGVGDNQDGAPGGDQQQPHPPLAPLRALLPPGGIFPLAALPLAPAAPPHPHTKVQRAALAGGGGIGLDTPPALAQ